MTPHNAFIFTGLLLFCFSAFLAYLGFGARIAYKKNDLSLFFLGLAGGIVVSGVIDILMAFGVRFVQ